MNRTYEGIARSIAAYERSSEVNQFSSKYDEYLKICVDELGTSKKDACLKGIGDKKTLDPENKLIRSGIDFNFLWRQPVIMALKGLAKEVTALPVIHHRYL